LVALILTVGSNAVVAVAMKPPNLVRAKRWVRSATLCSAGRELNTEKTSYTQRGERAIERRDVLFGGGVETAVPV
jgi:hypothetical protein